MTPTEFKATRARLGLTQHDLGLAMYLNNKTPGETISAWETGTNPIPGAVAVLMRYFEKYGMEEI